MTKRYVIKGINALGDETCTQYAYTDGECTRRVYAITLELVRDWDAFKIEIEAEEVED